MSSPMLNRFYRIEEFIALAKARQERDIIYMVYVPKDTDDLWPGMPVYIGDMPDFDEEDNEIWPGFVATLGLEAGYMQEHFQDVVDLAYRQKPVASTEEIIRCLNHYADYDDFLDLN